MRGLMGDSPRKDGAERRLGRFGLDWLRLLSDRLAVPILFVLHTLLLATNSSVDSASSASSSSSNDSVDDVAEAEAATAKFNLRIGGRCWLVVEPLRDILCVGGSL